MTDGAAMTDARSRARRVIVEAKQDLRSRTANAFGRGAVVLANSDLRACDVVPQAARKVVGTALVREMAPTALAEPLPGA
jgi:hypothetical protein